jgi:hypothetical protein
MTASGFVGEVGGRADLSDRASRHLSTGSSNMRMSGMHLNRRDQSELMARRVMLLIALAPLVLVALTLLVSSVASLH